MWARKQWRKKKNFIERKISSKNSVSGEGIKAEDKIKVFLIHTEAESHASRWTLQGTLNKVLRHGIKWEYGTTSGFLNLNSKLTLRPDVAPRWTVQRIVGWLTHIWPYELLTGPRSTDQWWGTANVLDIVKCPLEGKYREGNGTPLQYSCLENPTDGGAWWAAVHGVAKSRTRLSDFTFTFHFHALEREMATHSRVLAWRIPGTVEPGGLPSMGSHRVGHYWHDLAAAAGKKKSLLVENHLSYFASLCFWPMIWQNSSAWAFNTLIHSLCLFYSAYLLIFFKNWLYFSEQF